MDGVTSVISPVGRALQSKLAGMSQEQFQQYVMQQMNAGVIRSFPEILALKSQYDALQKGLKQQPAPQGTVADEMTAQMAPPPPQPAPPQAAGGLGTLPPAQPEFAHGGVVAFAGSGSTGESNAIDTEAAVLSGLLGAGTVTTGGLAYYRYLLGKGYTPEEARMAMGIGRPPPGTPAGPPTASGAMPATPTAPAAPPPPPPAAGPAPAGSPAAMTPEEWQKYMDRERAARTAAANKPPKIPEAPKPTKPSVLRTPISPARVAGAAGRVAGPALGMAALTGTGQMLFSDAGAEELRSASGRMERDTESRSINLDPLSILGGPVGPAISMLKEKAGYQDPLRRYMLEGEGVIPDLMLGADVLGRNILSHATMGRVRSPMDYREQAETPAKKEEKKAELTSLPDSVRQPTTAAPSIGLPTLKRPEIADFDMSGVDKPKERSKYHEEVEEEYKRRGVGAKDAEYEAQLAADRKDIEYNKRVAPWLALAQAGFRMAEEGGKSGATFLGSAGAGAQEGMRTYKQLKDDIRVANREQQKAERDLAAAQELRQMNMMQEGNALYRDALNRYDAYTLKKAEHAMKVAEMKFGYEGVVYSAQVNFAIAKMREMGAGDAANKALNQYWDALNRNDLKGAQAIAQAMNYWVNQTSPQLLKGPTGVLGGGGSGVQPTAVNPVSP